MQETIRPSDVLREATAVFGDEERAWRWMQNEVPALRYKRPVDLIQTKEGIKLVVEELRAIRHGIWP